VVTVDRPAVLAPLKLVSPPELLTIVELPAVLVSKKFKLSAMPEPKKVLVM
jgi:hypothetical protein